PSGPTDTHPQHCSPRAQRAPQQRDTADLKHGLTEIIDYWVKKVGESPEKEGGGRAVRGAHAKTFGVVRAEVEILSEVPAAYAQGIYAKPGRHDALIRFSSSSNHLGPDAQLGPVVGFAMKMFDVAGTKLVDDEPDATTFDLVLKNSPTFIANTAKHYLFIEDIGDRVGDYLARGRTGFHQLLADYLTGKGTLEQSGWAWEELFAFVKTAAETQVRNPLQGTYWTMASVRHGDHLAKVRVAAVAESAANVIHRRLDLGNGPDVFGPALVDELRARAFDFDLQVQLCTDLKAMPVNDTTVEWPEKLSPFVTVGRVHLPRQDITTANPEQADALAFNQWRVTSEHRPLGEIMDVRRVYSESARIRREINNQPQREPVSADEVLSLPGRE
ncbi:catalase family protein, partial [Streptomyces sp. NPDC008092]|uniref:catalase family protein n=1 Tax=Streptomyces sp. NPDC008092 TaxID=3364808 RepID=UPI0036F08D22